MVTVKDLFKKEREAWLEEARVTAKKLLEDKSLITIEDVLKECPRPEYIHRNTTGNIFRCDDFKPVGWRNEWQIRKSLAFRRIAWQVEN